MIIKYLLVFSFGSLGAPKTTETEGSYKLWFLESCLPWTWKPRCKILVFAWSLGPLVLSRPKGTRTQKAKQQETPHVDTPISEREYQVISKRYAHTLGSPS